MAREQARHRSLKHDQATPTRKLRARLEAAATVPGEALARLRNDFFSKSTRKPKASRMKLVLKVASKVAKTLERGRPPLPLSAEVLEGTAAVKEAGFKSAETYLVELKLAHVEKGHPWSHHLQRTLDLCKKSVRRNRGPKSKAPAVDLEKVTKVKQVTNWGKKKGKLAFSKESFLFAAVWILREDELGNLCTSDVRVEDRLVFLYLANSKTDVEAEGTLSVLQRRCTGQTCRALCPKKVSLDLLQKASSLHEAKETKGDRYLSPLHSGLKAAKAQTVRS